jgi:hypothetical protein
MTILLHVDQDYRTGNRSDSGFQVAGRRLKFPMRKTSFHVNHVFDFTVIKRENIFQDNDVYTQFWVGSIFFFEQTDPEHG